MILLELGDFVLPFRVLERAEVSGRRLRDVNQILFDVDQFVVLLSGLADAEFRYFQALLWIHGKVATKVIDVHCVLAVVEFLQLSTTPDESQRLDFVLPRLAFPSSPVRPDLKHGTAIKHKGHVEVIRNARGTDNAHADKLFLYVHPFCL